MHTNPYVYVSLYARVLPCWFRPSQWSLQPRTETLLVTFLTEVSLYSRATEPQIWENSLNSVISQTIVQFFSLLHSTRPPSHPCRCTFIDSSRHSIPVLSLLLCVWMESRLLEISLSYVSQRKPTPRQPRTESSINLTLITVNHCRNNFHLFKDQ
jgi:hypothetical protein